MAAARAAPPERRRWRRRRRTRGRGAPSRPVLEVEEGDPAAVVEATDGDPRPLPNHRPFVELDVAVDGEVDTADGVRRDFAAVGNQVAVVFVFELRQLPVFEVVAGED